MGLKEHARRELELAGLFDKDSDYEGALGEAVMALVDVFADQEHSGASAAMVRELFARVASYDTLTPITSDEAEWVDVSEGAGKPMWQNRRKPSVFSEDGGKTHYDIDNMPMGKTVTL